MGYVLYNEELGYINDCPTYETYDEAMKAAVFKCRFHSVKEDNDIQPCKPVNLHSGCLKCLRCAATVEARQEFIQSINNQ